MYKSQLQEYAQKAAIPPPVYEFVKEGASHEPRFKAIVILNNVQYESPPGFPNLKSAEHAAAKAALDGLLQTTGGTGVTPSPVHESGLCKNLLQEYAQKNSLPLPVYQSQRSGEDHAPTFTSSVEIAGVKYSGGSAKNKKEAEIKAARTALLAIQSAQSPPVPTPEPPISAAPQPHVGLATYISANLHNGPGKKRGRGATSATADEPIAARLKTGPQPSQAAPVDPVTPVTPVTPAAPGSPTPVAASPTPVAASPTAVAAPAAVAAEVPVNSTPEPMTTEKSEAPANSVTSTVPEVQLPITTAPPKFSSVDIADMFATPGAKKILGVVPKLPQTESSSLSQGTTPVSPEKITGSSSLLEDATANSKADVQGDSNTTEDRIPEESIAEKMTVAAEAQMDLVEETSEMKEDQAFMQAAQSSGLISLTG